MGLEALTKLLRKDEVVGRVEPLGGTVLLAGVLEENPRPCLNLAAPPPF